MQVIIVDFIKHVEIPIENLMGYLLILKLCIATCQCRLSDTENVL